MTSNKQIDRGKGVGIAGTIVTSGKLLFQACQSKEILLLAVGLLGSLIPSGMLFLHKRFFNYAEQIVADPSQTVLMGIISTLALEWADAGSVGDRDLGSSCREVG